MRVHLLPISSSLCPLQMMELPFPGHLLKTILAQGLVDAHRHGVAEVQAPGLGAHGQADAAVSEPLPEGLGKPGGLLAEEEPAVRRKPGLRVGPGGLGGGKPEVPGGLGMAAEQVLQVFVVENLHQVPVVQAAALHVPPDGVLGDVEAQGAHQMEAGPGGGAGAGDVPAVLGNLRFHQYDVQHRTPAFSPTCRNSIIVIHYLDKFNYILREN